MKNILATNEEKMCMICIISCKNEGKKWRHTQYENILLNDVHKASEQRSDAVI